MFMNFPTLNLNIPGIAFIVVEKLITICNFDFFFGYISMDLLGENFELPKKDVILGDLSSSEGSQLRVSMETIGYASAYTSKNMGSGYVVILLMCIGLLLIVCLKPAYLMQPKRRQQTLKGTKAGKTTFMKKKTQKELKRGKTTQMIRSAKTSVINKAQKVHGLVYEVVPSIIKFRLWLHRTLLWNFVIRMFIELSLLIAFCCLLTIRYAEFTGLMARIDVISAYILLGVLLIMPFFIFFFYTKNFDVMNSDDKTTAEAFDEKWGSPFEGLKK